MRSFIGFGQVPYIGQPQAASIKLFNIATQCVPLLFQWLSYGASTLKPSINVLVDLNGPACVRLDQIRSVYIDNLGCDQPVYVYFPDTQYTVVAKPNSEGWYPAFTNGKTFWVVGLGFLTNDIGMSNVIVTNLSLTPSVNVELDVAVALWKASPVITRGTSIYNSNFGVPALGDQTAQYLLDLKVAANTQTIFGTPLASGFITITSLTINLVNPIPIGASSIINDIIIESTGAAGILYDFSYVVIVPGASTNYYSVTPIYSVSGKQNKLDASQTWRIRNVTALLQGFANVIFDFTIGPT